MQQGDLLSTLCFQRSSPSSLWRSEVFGATFGSRLGVCSGFRRTVHHLVMNPSSSGDNSVLRVIGGFLQPVSIKLGPNNSKIMHRACSKLCSKKGGLMRNNLSRILRAWGTGFYTPLGKVIHGLRFEALGDRRRRSGCKV